MQVLVAPDKFRGTLTARQAAEAVETGWMRVRPGDDLDLAPMADGGEGSLDALIDALGGTTHAVTVRGPLGDPVEAAYGLAEAPDGRLAVVEMARASGLALLSEARRDPLSASTFGTGELIGAALGHEPDRIVVCIGGSATNDGGAGMAQALGARLLDAEGVDLGPGGAALSGLARIDTTGMDTRLRRVKMIVAGDVIDPLCGPSGASAVYGPQKGASAEDVRRLDRALAHLAAVVARDLGIDLKDEPGAGAAGGLGFGLMAFCGARLRPGVDVVMEAVGLGARLERASLVITGEGKFDAQSLRGKTPAGVLRLAALARVSAVIVCGAAEIPAPTGATVASLSERFGLEQALSNTRRCLETLSEELAARADDLTGKAEPFGRSGLH
jgi:glycerate kinase